MANNEEIDVNWQTEEAVKEAFISGTVCAKHGYAREANPFGYCLSGTHMEIGDGLEEHYKAWNKGYDSVEAG